MYICIHIKSPTVKTWKPHAAGPEAQVINPESFFTQQAKPKQTSKLAQHYYGYTTYESSLSWFEADKHHASSLHAPRVRERVK